MSFSAPPYAQSSNVLGRPQTFAQMSLGPDSENVMLGDTPDAWVLTYISGALQSDAPATFSIFVDTHLAFLQGTFTSPGAQVSPIQMYTFFVLSPTWRFEVKTSPIGSGGSYLELDLYVAGYRTGLNI